MSSSDSDDWEKKPIESFTVKRRSEPTDEYISKPAFQSYMPLDDAPGGNYGISIQQHQSNNKNVVTKMPKTILPLHTIKDPQRVLVQLLKYKTNIFKEINCEKQTVAYSNVIIDVILNAAKSLLDENVKAVLKLMLEANNFWTKAILSHLSRSTSSSIDHTKLWENIVNLCQLYTDHEIIVDFEILRDILDIARKIPYEIDIAKIRLVIKAQAILANQEKPVVVQDIFPCLEELTMETEHGAQLHPNIIKGKYENVDHYRNIHLALLREDFMIPFREGIRQIIADGANNKSIRSNNEVQVYPYVKIEIVSMKQNNRNNEIRTTDVIAATYRKTSQVDGTFMHGSLLCFSTSTSFQDLIVAVSLQQINNMSKESFVPIEIIKTYNITSIFGKEFIMYESKNFFEPYRHSYGVLKKLTEETFPMRDYIIEAKTERNWPSYVEKTKKYKYTFREKKIDLQGSWPSADDLQLNEQQVEAFKCCFTNAFSVIQGPPGTGKTFVGLEFVKALLKNTNEQIVIICYTNHILDQFLLSVLKFDSEDIDKNVVRIGSQSKCHELDKHNLHYLYANRPGRDAELNELLFGLDKDRSTILNDLSRVKNPRNVSSVNEHQHLADLLAIAQRKNELKQLGHYQFIKRKRVIGMTINGATKNHLLLEMLQPSVVIVEEAAEILEAHFVSSLNSKLQHLVLIGDHQQLQAKPNTYTLIRDYNIDVSLFERMVNNDIKGATLSYQRRMHPDISHLVRSVFYNELDDAIEVNTNPPVCGIEKRLFFLNHSEPESEEANETSKSNVFESNFILRLCVYLIKSGNSATDITILTAYNGQLKKLIKDSLKYPELEKVCKTVIDNYQGEQNKIVLLSLVRSNTDGGIGFLACKNRVCVALSRAQCGLYIVGNMNILNSNPTWKKIESVLIERDAIGNEMPLTCDDNNRALHVCS